MATILIDNDRCVQCGLCIDLCDWGVLDTDDDDTHVVPTHPEACTLCLVCQESCYEEAIRVEG